jgi:hypothetical protein
MARTIQDHPENYLTMRYSSTLQKKTEVVHIERIKSFTNLANRVAVEDNEA